MEKLIKFLGKQRVLTAVIFIAISIVAVIAGGGLWVLYFVILIGLGTREFVRLLKNSGIQPAVEVIYIFNLIFLLIGYLNQPQFLVPAIVFSVIVTFFRFLFYKKKVNIKDISGTIMGLAYTGFIPIYYVFLRNFNIENPEIHNALLPGGMGYLMFAFMIIWTSDIGAYAVGKRFGKRKLCPDISPNKTVEGAIGGTLSGIIMAIIMSFFTEIPLIHSIILGTIVVIVAQMGDLAESLLKRDAGVKDSGSVVPGHGGILDRADSYIFNGVVVYYYVKWILLDYNIFF